VAAEPIYKDEQEEGLSMKPGSVSLLFSVALGITWLKVHFSNRTLNDRVRSILAQNTIVVFYANSTGYFPKEEVPLNQGLR
jgi:hypothetical protein